MTEYLKPKFSVALGNAKFSEGWEAVFGEMAKERREVQKGIPGESPCPCPKCGQDAPCTDRVEVDIGVGIQTGCHEYTCPEHGRFGWTSEGVMMFDDDALESWRAPNPPGLDPCTKCCATGHEFPACGETSPPCPRCRGTKLAW